METIYETIRIRAKVSESRARVQDPESVIGVLKTLLGDLDADQEHFIILTLNKANEVTGFKVVHSGGMDEALVDPRIVFRNALLMGATGLVLCHNHPSGRIDPSSEDRALTVKLKEGGKLLGVVIVDHIILGKASSYFSFRENGII